MIPAAPDTGPGGEPSGPYHWLMEKQLHEADHEDRLLLALTELRWRLDIAGYRLGATIQKQRARKLISSVVDSWSTDEKDRAALTRRLCEYVLPAG